MSKARKAPYRFSSKFIFDFFGNKNTIIRKSDGYRWYVNLSFGNLEDKNGYKVLGDESLSMFFDQNNNFLNDVYDLTYIDHYKEWAKNELKTHAPKLLNNLPFNENSEQILKKILGV